ncbi:MAG: histidine phosphatase family protein [Rhodospirillales bacterium]|nr:histidine phosphatase family protein [Rhodospirillales bacterium]
MTRGLAGLGIPGAGVTPKPVRRIFLLRHAKSDWGDAGREDHDRDLSARGRDATGRMATYCRRAGIAPALILCSTATRARETLALVLPGLIPPGRVEYEDKLYLAEAERLLRRLQALDDDDPSVMVVGHNPGFHALAAALVGDGDPSDLQRLRQKFPTGALAEIEAPIQRWRDLEAGENRLARFIVPRELP